MKYLYLIRHAKSSWKDSTLDDFDRPLNKRGKRDAPEMGQRLRRKAVQPDRVLSSSATRAATTARAIARALDYPEKKIIFREELYHASPNSMLKQLRLVQEQVDLLFLVGHNPGLTALANQLCPAGVDNIVTCGIFALALPIHRWSDISPDSKADLLFYDYPKKQKPC